MPSVERQINNPNQPIRTGASKKAILDHFDTPFDGFDQVWNMQKGVTLFNDENRCKDDMLCSLEQSGQFSNDSEFHAEQAALEIEFSDPALYEIFVHYCQVQLYKQRQIQAYVWASKIGAGGGIFGGDVNTGAFHLNNGYPASSNMYNFGIPWIFPPQKTWEVQMQFLQLAGTTSPTDPRNPVMIFNADVGTETPTRKLVRFFLRGTQWYDIAP